MTEPGGTGRRIVGEFAPPREIVAVDLARISGRGTVEVRAEGLVFDGALHGVDDPRPLWGSAAVLTAAAVGSVAIPNGEQVLVPAAVLAVGGLGWMRFRFTLGVAGAHRVPWSRVEHVVRLASAPDTLAFVLDGPLAGRGTPEQVYFAPTEGVEALVEAIRTVAPPALTIDVDSAGAAPEPPPLTRH